MSPNRPPPSGDRPAGERFEAPPPAAADPPEAIAALSPEALHASLAEKTRLLIQRERDVQILLRRVHETNRWAEMSAVIAARVASCTTSESALEVLAYALAEDLGFEYAVVTWCGQTVEAPPLPTLESRERAMALLEACATSGPRFTTVSWPDALSHELAFGVAGVIATGGIADDVPRLFVGRTGRTATYSAHGPDTVGESLARLATVLAQSFSAVVLNVQLACERDSLQLSVDAATSDLRRALCESELAWAEAVRSASARTEFLANMSHEIRTPMTAVLGYAELLDDPHLSTEERSRYIGIVKKSGRHLLQIIDDILDLARIESGRVELDSRPSSLAAVLNEVIDMLAGTASSKGIALSLLDGACLPEQATVDAARLRQILINLTGNAVKFTSSGSVTLRASMDGSTVSVAVADTGIGIEADKLDLIFDAFEQSNASMSRQFGGTGLGLAISRRLARLMDGDIRVESTLGVGTCFTLSIRLRQMSMPAPQIEDVPPLIAPLLIAVGSPPVPVLRPTGLARVLLVEDTLANRTLVERYLSRAGYQVTTAVDGLDALEVVRRARDAGSMFDVMLLDMQMPNLDGYGCARQLRDDGVTIPIVALTAHAMSGDRERCFDAGCTDYLSKPVERPTLIQMVERHLGATNSGDRVTATEGTRNLG